MAGTEGKWAGAVEIGMGWSVYRGPIGEARSHRHLALQLTIPVEGPLHVQVGDDAPVQVAACLLSNHTPHLLIGEKTEIISLYADPLSTLGQDLKKSLDGDAWRGWRKPIFTKIQLDHMIGAAGGGQLSTGLHSVVAGWLGTRSLGRGAVDPRVHHAAEIINADLSRSHRLPSIAMDVGISPGRLSVLFRRDLGMAFRAYVQWARVMAAISAVAQGANGTDAAHEVGFADQAHFTRTFRRLFGTSPTGGLSANEFHVVSDEFSGET